jgi:chemotaxis protein MotB
MALSRRRENSNIWPGFVDAVTTLLMVLTFVLTIFTIMQSVLRDTITSQDSQLSELNAQLAELATALGLERARADDLQTEVSGLTANLAVAVAEGARQSALIGTLSATLANREQDLASAAARISSFEAQVATLLSERDAARGQVQSVTANVEALKSAQAKLITEQEAMQLALASARDEIDAQSEAARLAAARREALDALIADLRSRATADAASIAAANAAIAEQKTAIADQEAVRLVDAAALQALRDKLQGADDALTALTLALEAKRKEAEDTLILLAAAQTDAAKAAAAAAAQTAETLTERERDRALLALAEQSLTDEQKNSLEAAQKVALLNQQIAALRAQLGSLQALLDASASKDVEANVQLDALGNQLNAALAQMAAEQKRVAALEAAERKRLEAANLDLEKFRSDFFGQLRQVLAGREGVRVVGDRFVFSSEVLFTPGSADLAPEGSAQIASVVATLQEVMGEIPPQIDWIIRVDGHTDAIPISGTGEFADNWELSQARALSVVRYMVDELGFPPSRLAATGFGEFRPVAEGASPEALAQNRRIELKLTER